jgi:hypothetical protein
MVRRTLKPRDCRILLANGTHRRLAMIGGSTLGHVPATRIMLAAVRLLLGFISSVYLDSLQADLMDHARKLTIPIIRDIRPWISTLLYGLPILHPRDRSRADHRQQHLESTECLQGVRLVCWN